MALCAVSFSLIPSAQTNFYREDLNVKSKPQNKTTKPTSHPLLLDHLSDVAPYPPGKPIEEVQREYGLDEVIKLASNENPLGPSPRAVKAMNAASGEMNLYPDGGGYYLKQKLSDKLGVTPEEIVLGNGSDEITLFLALSVPQTRAQHRDFRPGVYSLPHGRTAGKRRSKTCRDARLPS